MRQCFEVPEWYNNSGRVFCVSAGNEYKDSFFVRVTKEQQIDKLTYALVLQ